MAPPPARGRVTVRFIEDEHAWDALRPEWDELYAGSPNASAPVDFAWLRNWWRIYGAACGAGGLRIVTVWRGSRLVGALPLYEGAGPLGVRSLRFLSTGEAEYEETCPDYLDILCLAGEEAACAEALWRSVERLDWEQLELLDVPEPSLLLRSRARPSFVRTIPRGSCPVADLSGGFEAYLRRLSSNMRQQARRLLREGERAGAALEVVDAGAVDGAFADLVRLHQARWTARGKPGVFAAPRFTAFHREMLREWLPCGRAVLARLSAAGGTTAVLYGFVTGSRFEFYQSGVRLDDGGPLRSPGVLAHLLLMRHLTARGVTTYDFLRGASSYKERLATHENGLVAVRAWRPTIRTAAFRSVRFAARAARRSLQALDARWAVRWRGPWPCA